MFETHLKEAIAICEQALATGVGFDQACQRLGNVLQGMGKFQEAVTWHTQALQHPPHRVAVYAGLGNLYASQQQWQLAISAYEQALHLDPHNADLYRHLASLYGRVGQPTEEVMYRYQAVTLNPGWANPSNQLMLGNTLMAQGKLTEAIACYQRGIHLYPDFYAAYYNLGVALTQQEQWQEAIAAFTRGLEINPDHAASHYGLGKLAVQQERLTDAASHYGRSLELNADAADVHYALGDVWLKLRQWQQAEASYRQAIALDASLVWAHHGLGYALLKQQQWQQAATVLQQAAILNPASPWTHYHLGTALLRQQQWQAAIAAFLSAVQLQADLAGVYTHLGYGMRHCLQTAGAATLEYCQQAIALERQTADFYAQVAEHLAQAQQFDGAIAFYDLALLEPNPQLQQQRLQALTGKQHLDQRIAEHRLGIQQQPDHAWLYTHLGNLLADQGEGDEAIALHRAASVLKGWTSAATRHYQFSHDWFTHNIPVWVTYLQPFAHSPHTQALEIGSFEGMSACWLLDHVLTHPLSHLTCIDQYFQEAFETNVAQTGSADRITQLIGDSHSVLSTLAPETYDIIYIDGCHWADHVRQDATLSWKLLKAGGVVIFDDYQWSDPNRPGQDTQLGIDAFLQDIHGQAAIIHQGYQIVIEKLRTTHLTPESESFSEKSFLLGQISSL